MNKKAIDSLFPFIGKDVVLERVIPKERRVKGEIIHETPTTITVFYNRRGKETSEILPLSNIQEAKVRDQEWEIGAFVEIKTLDFQNKRLKCHLHKYDGTYIYISYMRRMKDVKEKVPIASIASLSYIIPQGE